MNNEELLTRALLRVFTKILVFKTREQVKDTLVEYFSKDFVDAHIQISGFTLDALDGSGEVYQSVFKFYLVDEGVAKIRFTITPQKVDGITKITGGNRWF